MSKKKTRKAQTRLALKELEASLTSLAKVWAGLLGISDWKISVEIVRRKDLKGHKNQDTITGMCNIDMHERIAAITIIYPKDHVGSSAYDPEAILLHEVLHIPLDYFSGRDLDCDDYYDPKNIMREQFINRMTDVLMGFTKEKKETND